MNRGDEWSSQTATGDGVEFEQHPLTSLSLSHSQDSAALFSKEGRSGVQSRGDLTNKKIRNTMVSL